MEYGIVYLITNPLSRIAQNMGYEVCNIYNSDVNNDIISTAVKDKQILICIHFIFPYKKYLLPLCCVPIHLILLDRYTWSMVFPLN